MLNFAFNNFRPIDNTQIPKIADLDSAVPLLRKMWIPCQVTEVGEPQEGM